MDMGMGLSTGLSDAEFCLTVLAAFSLALPLHSVCSFLWAFSEVPSRRSSSAMALLGLGHGPKINWAWARATLSLAPQ